MRIAASLGQWPIDALCSAAGPALELATALPNMRHPLLPILLTTLALHTADTCCVFCCVSAAQRSACAHLLSRAPLHIPAHSCRSRLRVMWLQLPPVELLLRRC